MNCPKCGQEPHCTSPRYHREDYGVKGCHYFDNNKRRDEHLHYYCACGYDWTIDVAFPKEGAKP